jgi:uncharacterized protein (DUF433 family)
MNEMVPELPPLRLDDQKVIRVGATRVTLDSVVAAFHRGETPEQIAQNYDALSLSQVYRALGYYLEHRIEIDRYIEEGRSVRGNIQGQIETMHDPTGIRSRLLARKTRAS